ncbi:DEKNAAC101822 [Brettanomyces naardenensis]|uniref:DEKNAAC101822 n=1 Tax=Brettanomyces naardenensis TaxID=13370 RepID=A0A448YJ10_BRENA|nr:DEKNAAC101822 [Brettanomyces naardenensis]
MGSRLVCYHLQHDPGTISSSIIDESFHGSSYKVIVAGPNELLFVQGNSIICTHGTIITRRFSFESEVVDCFYTTFNSEQKGSASQSKPENPLESVLVIVFKDQIRVYSKNGGSKVVTLPFHTKRAFPFQNGIVINKKPDISISLHDSLMNPPETAAIPTTNTAPTVLLSTTPLPSHASTESNFLTLLDPLDDPGLIASSSITSFSSKEELTSFPATSAYCLATMLNPLEHKVNVYHVRYLSTSRGPRKKSGSYLGIRKASTRTASSSSGNQPLTPSTSRNIEEEFRQRRSSSTLSYDRMASGSEFKLDPNSGSFGLSPFDTQRLRKDIIFTKLSSFPFKSDIKYLKVLNISYQEQEALVICNLESRTIDFLIFTNPGSLVSLPTFKSKFSINGWDAVSFCIEAGHSGYVVLQKSASQVVLFNPFMKLLSPIIDLSPKFPPITSLDGSYNSTLLIRCEDGKHYLLDLDVRPLDSLVSTLLDSFKYIANSYIYEFFWLRWCGNKSLHIPYGDDWNLFVITLLSSTSLLKNIQLTGDVANRNDITRLLPFVRLAQKRSITLDSSAKDFAGDYSLDSLLPVIVLSIHLIREDLRLNNLAAEWTWKLSVFLCQLVSWMGWSEEWFRYYMIDSRFVDRQARIIMAQPITSPPNLFQSLSSLFTDSIVPYVTFSQLVEEDETVDELIIPRTFYILRLFEVLISPQFEAEDLVRMMADYGIKKSDLETYPSGVYIILKNQITLCQNNIKSQWNLNSEELKLIDRKDLLQFGDPASVESLVSSQISAQNLKSGGAKEMTQILKYVNNNDVLSAWDGQAEADKFHVTRLIFSEDRRFYEVTRLLQTSKVQTSFLKLPSSMDENDKLSKQRALGAKIALRTLTMPLGRGAVFISSRKPLVTEKFPIPRMNFNALILPDMINVSLEKDSLDSYLYDWGYFHNGVSAGLMTSRDFSDISGGWIVFNRPATLNAQHAGFLLGLGLNGHLKGLEEWHIYNYLGPKHSFTSIGLLLGMAASLKGTMDIKLTKVLSVHVVALLPQGSTDLNVQLPVQTAGIVGIGLLYMGSQHRRMTEMLLSQISSVLSINDQKVVNEGYRLAAGISLGYINLGKGKYLKESTDTHVVDLLFSLATLIKDIETPEELDKSCGGAIMALMFMFLKTNSLEAAEKLAIPKTKQLLDYVRPDFLMLRCMARNLVLWDLVDPTKSWVERQIPACVSDSYDIDAITELDSEMLPYLNILGGILLSVAIRFASTSNLVAKQTLLDYLDKLMLICSLEPVNYDERIALIGARNVRDVVLLGLSIIMSGTGDLEIMRRLRYLQGATDKYTNYGNYMAVNTGLGFLFLGGGQQAFKTDDDFSIAALITSIYPVYSTNNYDCMSECVEVLLQALRHFWALAVENRCLVVRDMADKQPIKVDVDVELNDTSIIHLDSPCLLPELNQIHKISACANGRRRWNADKGHPDDEDYKKYFSVEFDFCKSDRKQCDAFKKNLTLFAYERTEYQNLKLDFDSLVSLEEAKEQDTEGGYLLKKTGPLSCLEDLSIFKGLKSYERGLYFRDIEEEKALTESSVIDLKIEVEKMLESDFVDKFWNLKLLFNYVDKIQVLGRKERARARVRRRNRCRIDEKRSSRETILDLQMKEEEEEASDEDDFGYDDTFEKHLDHIKPNQEDDAGVMASDDMSYLNVKFIENVRNELFRRLKMGNY